MAKKDTTIENNDILVRKLNQRYKEYGTDGFVDTDDDGLCDLAACSKTKAEHPCQEHVAAAISELAGMDHESLLHGSRPGVNGF